MELQGAEFLISITFQRKRYVSIARAGNFIMYVCARSLFAETVPFVSDHEHTKSCVDEKVTVWMSYI